MLLTIAIPDDTDPSPSRTYILRCWVERDVKGQNRAWRFRLKKVDENDWYGFADFDSLASYLKTQLIVSSTDDQRKVDSKPT